MNATGIIAPITAAEIPAEWIDARHAIVKKYGYATRAGEGHTIEVKSLTTDRWNVLALANGSRQFATAADRDAVLKLLQEGRS